MQNFEKFPKLTEYIAEMANTGKAPKEWSKFLAELNQALQLLQSRVIESVCINCGQERNKHSKATELCPDRFKHYEQTVP